MKFKALAFEPVMWRSDIGEHEILLDWFPADCNHHDDLDNRELQKNAVGDMVRGYGLFEIEDEDDPNRRFANWEEPLKVYPTLEAAMKASDDHFVDTHEEVEV